MVLDDTQRLDAIQNGFSVWCDVNLSTGDEQWFCQYSIEGISVGNSLREALDKGVEANERRT